jgi:hypothetical protein
MTDIAIFIPDYVSMNVAHTSDQEAAEKLAWSNIGRNM